VALSPLTFIERSASIYPDYPALVHGETRRSWAETWARCRRLASALEGRGIKPGETVAAMLPNVPAMFEAHFGVPLAGCVLNTLNIRLDAEAIAYMLEHGEARVVLVDPEFADVIEDAVSRLAIKPLVIDVDDALFEGEARAIGELEYEALLAEGDPEYPTGCPRTSGRRSRSTTPPAPPASPRGWSTTIAEPTSMQ
jgi:fatty-acyl-CoA synthase